MNKKILFLGLVFISCLSILNNFVSQVNLDFVKYLSNNNLQREHWTYIEESGSSDDSIHYFKAKYYLQYSQDSMFLESFSKSPALFLKDSIALNYTCAYFIRKTENTRETWFTMLSQHIDSTNFNNELISLYYQAKDPSMIDTLALPESLREDFYKYKKAYSKKPGLAAFLSAIVPGLGELYIGNFRSFGAKFTSHGIFGLQIYESIIILGLIHPLPIINLAFLTAFYGANIVGSYHDTKIKKTDTKNQLFIHASEYYSDLNQYSLY